MSRRVYRSGFVFLMGLFSWGVICAQEEEVTGQVTGEDSNDTGLPGVTILEKGTSNGAVSDIDGNYTIRADKDAVLIFSFVGYKSQEVSVNGRTRIDVTLGVDLQSLEEVVIVGYGEQKKANLTGAVTTVDSKELEDIPTSNLSQTLIGKLAGVQVNRNGTGIPGTPSELVIRDESASGNIARQVLYVIDGVIYVSEQSGTGPSGAEVFNRLDASEIESISILKDAAAAVYGARAAGGVVLVKTKRGKAGKPRFNYSGSAGIGQPTRIPEMLSGYEHALMLNEIANIKGTLPGGRPPRSSDLFSESELEVIRSRDYDWLDGLFESAKTYRHVLNVSGGSEAIRYFFGGNYYYESGNYENLWYKRFGLRSNIEADISANLTFSLGVSFSEGNRKNPSYDPPSGDTGEGVLRDWYKRPLTAPKWLDPVVDGKPVRVGTSWNPHGLLASGSHRTSLSNNLNILPQLTYNVPFVEGLKLGTQFSYNINTSSGTRYNQNYKVYEQVVLEGSSDNKLLFKDEFTGNTVLINNSESLFESWRRGVNYQLNASANYSRTIGVHTVNVLAVYEQTDGHDRDMAFTQTGGQVRGYPYVWAFNGTALPRGLYHQIGRWGVIGRLNYDYKNKYLLESAFRGEASSKFAESERFGFFPTISAGWVMSEESFFSEGVPFINFFKIRVSTGILGNDNTIPYEHQVAFIPEGEPSGPIFGPGDGAVSGTIEARKNGFTVPSRTWAKVWNNNVGVDLRALDHRLTFTFEYYYNKTYDGFDSNNTYPMVIGNPKPPFENHRVSFSTGQEFSLGWSDKLTNGWSYSIDANLSRRRSRPLKLYQNPAVLGTWVDQLNHDDSNQPGLVALGIIRTDEDLEMVRNMYYNGDGTINGVPIARGMIYYADIGGPNYSREPDGILDGNDRTIIAEYTSPPYSYGFTLSATWKGLKVSCSFGGVFGHKDFINKDEQSAALITSNVFSWWSDYWTEENPEASMPRPHEWGFAGEHSTFWMRDGHTLRLNFVNLSYEMPEVLSKKLKLGSWRMFVSADNVWTIISPFDYKDPAVSRAYDYPLVRKINLGTNFSF